MTDLLRTTDAGVTSLTLHRPDSLNALTTDLLRELRAALDDVQDSPAVRALVLTGAGGAFCAGADLKEFATPSVEGGQRRIRLVTEVLARLRNLEQPTVAAVTGAAYGAGWGLALVCDLTVASASARFSLPEVPKGMRLPTAITTRLVEVVGPVRAAEIALGGATYGPDEGVAHGWLSHALPDDEAALDHATNFARRVAASPRASVANVKQVLRRRPPHDLTPPPEYAWNEEK
jgi:enoyl-CoA hydratase/carnithine racemase